MALFVDLRATETIWAGKSSYRSRTIFRRMHAAAAVVMVNEADERKTDDKPINDAGDCMNLMSQYCGWPWLLHITLSPVTEDQRGYWIYDLSTRRSKRKSNPARDARLQTAMHSLHAGCECACVWPIAQFKWPWLGGLDTRRTWSEKHLGWKVDFWLVGLDTSPTEFVIWMEVSCWEYPNLKSTVLQWFSILMAAKTTM